MQWEAETWKVSKVIRRRALARDKGRARRVLARRPESCPSAAPRAMALGLPHVEGGSTRVCQYWRMTATVRMRLAAALGSLFAVAATACGGGNATRSRPPVATTTITADPRAAERTAVLAAFDEYNRFYVQAIANPNPEDPSLAAHLTGSALLHMRLDLAGFRSTHEGVRLSDVADDPPIVVSIDAQRAVIDDCTRSIAH